MIRGGSGHRQSRGVPRKMTGVCRPQTVRGHTEKNDRRWCRLQTVRGCTEEMIGGGAGHKQSGGGRTKGNDRGWCREQTVRDVSRN